MNYFSKVIPTHGKRNVKEKPTSMNLIKYTVERDEKENYDQYG